MANVLSIDKQVAIVRALVEGSSIRAIERMTGVHRDTIMRLSVALTSTLLAVRAATLQEQRELAQN